MSEWDTYFNIAVFHCQITQTTHNSADNLLLFTFMAFRVADALFQSDIQYNSAQLVHILFKLNLNQCVETFPASCLH